jgi:hypothetical protein
MPAERRVDAGRDWQIPARAASSQLAVSVSLIRVQVI